MVCADGVSRSFAGTAEHFFLLYSALIRKFFLYFSVLALNTILLSLISSKYWKKFQNLPDFYLQRTSNESFKIYQESNVRKLVVQISY